VETLFGPGHRLTRRTGISQPGQFACEETVTLVGPKGSIPRVRVLGPERAETQVEISRTDQFALGIDAPVRVSGEVEGTPGLRLEGPAGTVDLRRGVMVARRHVHMTPRDADRFRVKDQEVVMVRVVGERGIVFDDVLVRVTDTARLDMHLDTDEANAADLGPESFGILILGPTIIQPEP
jgi:propanediol utilization protein